MNDRLHLRDSARRCVCVCVCVCVSVRACPTCAAQAYDASERTDVAPVSVLLCRRGVTRPRVRSRVSRISLSCAAEATLVDALLPQNVENENGEKQFLRRIQDQIGNGRPGALGSQGHSRFGPLATA